ncbi:MAG: excinuclease ABC subunit UvrC, partial [Desulfobaccales bacterium]
MGEGKVKDRKNYPEWAGVLAQAPRAAGVYLFKDAGGMVLYVGKAVNLKNRLSSYLKTPEKHDPKTALMLKKAVKVDMVLTSQAREALILERTLIKEHAPRYNVRLRDDKNFLCLRLHFQEAFPALRFVRRFANDGALYFGPYTSSGAVRETMKVMKQVFGLRTCKERRFAPRTRPCLEGQMGRCLAPCAGGLTAEAYRQVVHQAVQFLRGRGRNLLRQLKGEMEEAAANLDFEKAARLRDRIQAINATLERQAMARPTSRDQDVVGVAQEGEEGLVLIFLVRAGLVTGSLEYYFAEIPAGGDLLGAFLKQYYGEGRPLPDEILLPWDTPDRKLLAEVLSEQRGKPVRLAVGKGAVDGRPSPSGPEPVPGAASRKSLSERRRLLALAQENARVALSRRQSLPRGADPLADLQKRLNLAKLPQRLECLDISTLQGGQPVGALVAFAGGQPDKSGYRRFRIREVAGQDDYAMLQEVVRRHYGKEGQVLPDLLVVDGGKGQLGVVLEALKDLGLAEMPVVGLAKAAEQGGREVPDRLFLPGRKNPKMLPASSPGWLLLLRIRDEAHRFAITYHRRRARKELVASALGQVPGMGPVRQKLLLRQFTGLEELMAATVEELRARGRLPQNVAQTLKDWLNELDKNRLSGLPELNRKE